MKKVYLLIISCIMLGGSANSQNLLPVSGKSGLSLQEARGSADLVKTKIKAVYSKPKGANGINPLSTPPLFFEDFTNGMPAGFTLVDVDGNTPDANVAFVTDAWIADVDILDTTNFCAYSTSWYSPAGASDDWMITSAITLPAGQQITLSWDAVAPDPAYADGYEVRVSTTGVNTADFTNLVYSNAAESDVWTPRTANLSAFAGSTVYIAFRNNSNDKFLLMVDNIDVTASTTPPPSTAVWSDDFSDPSTWFTSNDAGNNDDWIVGTTPPSGSFAISPIASTTAFNGFALFDSDLLCSGNQHAHIVNATPIDLTGHPKITLDFEQFYGRYVDSTFVSVSVDGVNWTKYVVNPTLPVNTTTANPDLVSIDISPVAGNQATVWVRFTFYSPSSMGASAGCGYSWMVDDVEINDFPSEDAGVTDILSPVSGCGLSAQESVTIEITNFGLDTLSNFPVAYSINSGAPVVETYSGSILPGATAQYTFTTVADLKATNSYFFVIYTDVANDGQHVNDTAFIFIDNATATDLTTPLTMGFEASEDLLGWAVQDANADGVTWAIANTLARTGTNCIRKGGSGAPDNDWLFTKCLDLVTGQTYKLEYYYKNFELVDPSNLEARIGMAQDTTMSQVIVVNTFDTVYHYSTTNFTIPANGRYYIGWKASSAAGSSSIRIDDITVSKVVVTALNEKVQKEISLYPNPSTGKVMISNGTLENMNVKVYNSMGQVVLNGQFSGKLNQELDLSSNPDGVYMMEIRTGDSVINKKLVISRF